MEADADQAGRQLATLNRVARIAVQDLALQPMLQRIVDALAAEFGWDFVACATVDRARNEFVCKALHSTLSSDVHVGYRRALGSGVVGECALTGKTFDIEDTNGHANFVDTLDGTRSELCVPIEHNGEVLAVLNAESRRPGAFRGQRALFETVANQVAGVLYAARLLEELRRANAQLQGAYRTLEDSARTDSLTGVANRRRFDQFLAETGDAAARSGRPMAVLLVDVDHFKAFNDGYGHPAGDSCLRRIAAALREAVQGTSLCLARYGGEEFAAAGHDVDLPTALALAERMRSEVHAAGIAHAHVPSGRLGVSIGVAAGRPDAGGPENLVAAADAALYAAKAAGRDRVHAATDS